MSNRLSVRCLMYGARFLLVALAVVLGLLVRADIALADPIQYALPFPGGTTEWSVGSALGAPPLSTLGGSESAGGVGELFLGDCGDLACGEAISCGESRGRACGCFPWWILAVAGLAAVPLIFLFNGGGGDDPTPPWGPTTEGGDPTPIVPPPATVPEPASLTLLGAGLAAILARRRQLRGGQGPSANPA